MVEVKSPYGLRKGKLIHISEILDSEKGLKCNCVCSHCNDPLIAKLGRVRVRHFAHSNLDCGHGLESALHLKAKQILEKERKLVIPDIYYGSRNLVKSQEIIFDEIYLEKRLNNIIPDLILEKGSAQLLVEIAVTHFVDEAKIEKIKSINLSALEIQIPIDLFDKNQFDDKIVTEHVVYSTANKKWLNNLYANNWIKAEQEKQRKREEDHENNRQKELANIRLLLDPLIHAKKKIVWEKEVFKNRDWQRKLSYLQINANNVPNYLNIEINNDFVFQCDRRLWQTEIFSAFIYLKKITGRSRLISVTDVIQWIYDRNYIPFTIKLKDLSQFPELENVKDLKGVITSYLFNLARYGFLSPRPTESFIVQTFYRTENKIKLLPSTYKSPKFIEQSDLLIDTETGEIIGNLKDVYLRQ